MERGSVLKNLTLVLTASVDPRGMPGQSRNDPTVREQDYERGLGFYVGECPSIRKIVFVENSGWPLDKLRRAADGANTRGGHGKDVEFISLNCNDFPREKGKGHGETLLLDLGLDASVLAKGARYWGKMTGRNYLLNLEEVVDSVRRPFEFLIDLRDHKMYDFAHRLGMAYRDGHHADTRFFVCTPAFYDRHLRGLHRSIDEGAGTFMEATYYQIAKDPALRDQVIRRFPIEPDYRGIGGWLGKDYGSPRERLKRGVRGITRRVAPWLHI
jgi:hypothetical protein